MHLWHIFSLINSIKKCDFFIMHELLKKYSLNAYFINLQKNILFESWSLAVIYSSTNKKKLRDLILIILGCLFCLELLLPGERIIKGTIVNGAIVLSVGTNMEEKLEKRIKIKLFFKLIFYFSLIFS
jgi:hypothetical protein